MGEDGVAVERGGSEGHEKEVEHSIAVLEFAVRAVSVVLETSGVRVERKLCNFSLDLVVRDGKVLNAVGDAREHVLIHFVDVVVVVVPATPCVPMAKRGHVEDVPTRTSLHI